MLHCDCVSVYCRGTTVRIAYAMRNVDSFSLHVVALTVEKHSTSTYFFYDMHAINGV